MICRCFGHSIDLAAIGRRARETAELMVGLPDYNAYLSHMGTQHPEQEAMSREAFFVERQTARYGVSSGRFRCC